MLDTHLDGSILTLRMARLPVNALDPALIETLHAAILEAKGAEAIIVTGLPGMFSAGLDVPTLMGLGDDALKKVWRAYFGLCQAIADSPVPICGAISGHCPAGGAVLALHMDYRIMAEGKYLIGLNETRVGLILPEHIYRVFAYVVGARQAERLAVSGLMTSPQDALRVGLVDEVVAAEAVHARAVEWCQSMLQLPRRAMLANREMARQALRAAAAAYGPALDGYLAEWNHPDTQSALVALLAKLGKR